MVATALLKSYLFDTPWALRLGSAHWRKHKEALVRIEEACFDEHMRADVSDLEDLIRDRSVLAMVLFDADKAIGYIVGAPLESESSYFDPDTDPNEGWGDFDTIYINNVSILPEHRNHENFKFMVSEYILHVRKAGYRRATMHARKSNGLSTYCIRKLKCKKLKTIENWFDCGEGFDFLVLPLGQSGSDERLPVWHSLIVTFRYCFKESFLERYFRAEDD